MPLKNLLRMTSILHSQFSEIVETSCNFKELTGGNCQFSLGAAIRWMSLGGTTVRLTSVS